MSREVEDAKNFFGYCITSDKDATPIFEQLLRGIHGYITKHVNPCHINYLTPRKLARFYSFVGGNFDRLFLDSSSASLSFVYSSLGCEHSLHQDQNFFEPPTVPALTARGFVRWQVIQILLAPAEHVPYLQEAVKRFEILNEGPGGPFPKVLPAECLPQVPDPDITRWHEGVEKRLRHQAEISSRPTSARTNPAGVSYEQVELKPVSSRRQPQMKSPQSKSPRRGSSSEARVGPKFPNSPHPIKNAQQYKKASVISGSSSSSSSSPSPPPRNARLADPERSPRSYSLARHPYAQPTMAAGRRHSLHGAHDNQKSSREVRHTLSPHFFAENQMRSAEFNNGTGPVKVDSQPSNPTTSVMAPQNRYRGHRHTVSHDRSKEATWRDKISAYMGMTTSVDDGSKGKLRRRGSSETRIPDRDRRVRDPSDDSRYTSGVRFVDGVGGIPMDRRPTSPKRSQKDEDREPRRRSRYERRRQRSEGESSNERYYEGS